ncbi:MAG: OmpH family outer membrane protein [Vicinamibacterales bacterium]
MLYAVRFARTFTVAVFGTAILSTAAAAQSSWQIVGVNLNYVAANSKFGKAALARIEAANKQKTGEADAKLAALTKQQSELQKTVSTMSDRARADLQRAFDRAQVDFDRFREDAQAELRVMQTQFETEFRLNVTPLVDQLSRERGYAFVFGLEHPIIAWFSPDVDISEEIVKRLDAQSEPKH